MPKHKDEEKFWGYLIEQDKSPTPLFQALLIGISHYIIKNVAPWETKTLTPSKMAHFYRLVGGNYDSLFLESPNASIAFIYKSLGCYHSLQPTRDPFAGPSIPALTNDGFVRWQTVQLLLGPEEHVPFLQEAVKRFEIKNPIHGGYFPRFLPAEALPRKPDPEMCRWHEQVGDRLLRESGAAETASITESAPSLEGQPMTDAGQYVSSPPAGVDSPRPKSFEPSAAAAPQVPADGRQPRHVPGLKAPVPSYVRRHSVPDRARGEFDEKPTRVFSSPTSAGPVPPQNGDPGARRPSYDTTVNGGGRGTSPRPHPSRQDTAQHRRSNSSTSPPPRRYTVRSHSHDRPGSISHSRSPPRMGPVPERAQVPQPIQVPPVQITGQMRPPLAGADPSRRHTTYAAAKEYPVHHPMPHPRSSSGAIDPATGRVVYPMAPPQVPPAPHQMPYYPPPAGQPVRIANVAQPPQPVLASVLSPTGTQPASPPSRQGQFPTVVLPTSTPAAAAGPLPVPAPVPGAIPIRQHIPHPHAPASAPAPIVTIPVGQQPPPNTPYARSPPSRHPAASAAVRPSSSSSDPRDPRDPPLPVPNPAPVAAQAGVNIVSPPNVRFAPQMQDPNGHVPGMPEAVRVSSAGSEHRPDPRKERVRRRTIEEVAREQERARDEMDFEYGRRRQRPMAATGPNGRRSRSRGDGRLD